MTWNKNEFNNTDLFKEISEIRAGSDRRREVEADVLAQNNLASVRQLSEDKKNKFIAIVDAVLEGTLDGNDVQLFPESDQLNEAASKIKVTPWTKQDNNPEKNSTFMGAPKDNPNKGGYAGGAKAEKTKHGYTAMKRIKEEDEGLEEGLVKTVTRALTGRNDAAKRAAGLDHPIRQAQMQSRSRIHGKASSDQGMSRFVSRLNAKNKYDDIAKGKPGLKFGTRKEDLEEMYLDIENFVLESEGLDSIDHLNEQGQEKLAAVVENVMEEILSEEEETMEEGWFSGSATKKSPTPNPKGAPRGERDEGDHKNPSGVPNKKVSQAVRNDRKLAKRNNGRLSGEGY